MADEKKESRINVENLPVPETELSDEDAKNVQGGALGYRESDFNFALKAADGSVQPQGYNTKGDPVAK